MFGAAKTPFGTGGFGSTASAFGAQQTTPFGASSGGRLSFCFNFLNLRQ